MTQGLTNCRLKVARHRSRRRLPLNRIPMEPIDSLEIRPGMQILLGKVGYSSEIYHASKLAGV